METVRIGVLTGDREYRNALLRGLSHESRDFQFVAIAGWNDVQEIRECQIILTDNDGCCEGAEQRAVISLTYHEMYDMGSRAGRMEIFRYEDARVFVGKIIYFYAKAMGIDLYFHGRRKCRKVVFSSLRGGTGTTAAAMTSARFLKYRFDKKTLFISLCPLDGSRQYTGSGDGGNMLSLLYHLNAGEDVPLCKFISSQEGVDHFRGQTDNRVAAEMTNSEMKQLLRLIDRMGEYDYVIFDVGDHIGSLARFLMERADVKVIIRQRSEIKDRLDDIYRDDKNNENIINVVAFDDGNEEGDNYGLPITYDPDAFIPGEKRTYIDIRGKYGKDICLLAERIVGCAE